MSHRARIRAEAAEWFARANAGGWSRTEQVQLDDWLTRSRSHRAAYWRLEGAWQEAARLAALRPRTRKTDVNQGLRSLLIRALAGAAVVAGLSVIASTNYQYSKNGTKLATYATAIGEHRVLNLSDGSRIELNTDTLVRLATANGARKVWLIKGEAFFRINHDAAHPFEVVAGSERVTDLGTQFLVRQHVNHLEVAVVEGRARLEFRWHRRCKAIGGAHARRRRLDVCQRHKCFEEAGADADQ